MTNSDYENPSLSNVGDDEELNLREIFEKYFYYWKWFLFSLIIAVTLAFIYLRYAARQYETKAQVMLVDKTSGAPELDALKGILGDIQTSPEVEDQIEVIKSRRLITKVVEKHKLNRLYYTEGRLKSTEITEAESPIIIVIENPTAQYEESFEASLLTEIKDNKIKVIENDLFATGVYRSGQSIDTKIGTLRFLIQSAEAENSQIRIVLRSVSKAVDDLRKDILVTAGGSKNKNTKTVEISMTGPNKKRAEVIINSLIEIYDQDTKDDSKRVANATVKFISERLGIVTGDLTDIDRDLEDFKTLHKTNDPLTEAGEYFSDAMATDRKSVEIATRLEISKHLESVLNSKDDELLPVNIGIEDQSLNTAIDAYNRLMLEKQDNSKSLKENNPLMKNLNQSISDVKISIRKSLHLYQDNLKSQMGATQNQKSKTEGKLNQFPKQESGLRKIARQQQIVESIYLFLLQKREEAEIRGAATVDAVKVVDYAYTSPGPVAPKTQIIYLAAILLGLVVPFGAIYLKLMFDNKVKDKKDIRKFYSGPYLGEIPTADEGLIGIHDNSGLAEAFRILRGNLKFLLPQRKSGRVLIATSTVSGEGKTFVAINLAQILALTSKKVILIGADLRVPKLLDYLELGEEYKNSGGLSNLLAEDNADYRDVLIQKQTEIKFDLIHSGPIPPNPAELLMVPKWKELIERLKTEYDYIVIDTAPIGMVEDTGIIGAVADATLYVVRANYLDKRMLEILGDNYNSNKFKNMAVVLNDINYSRGYGYGYGYGYGQGYRKKGKKRGRFLRKK